MVGSTAVTALHLHPEPRWDGETALAALWGKVLVAINEPAEQKGSIFVTGAMHSDVGTVVAAGRSSASVKKGKFQPDPDGKWTVPTPNAGDRVLYRPDRGTRIADAETGGDSPWLLGAFGVGLTGELGVFGTMVVPWWNEIMALVDSDGNIVSVTGDNVLIRRDETSETEGGLVLPDSMKGANGMGIVVEVGPLVRELKPGDRVCYLLDGSKYAFEIDRDKRLVFVKERGVLYRLL